MKLSRIFEPFDIGKLKLRNRIVLGPLATSLAGLDHLPTQKMADYYAERAKGGVGLVIVEHTASQPVGLYGLRGGAIYSEESIPGYRRIVEKVHAHGAKIAIEIGNAGNTGVKELLA